MRIAQVAALAESVPPKLYGGTERVVSWLTEELVRQGHDVTLFASGDSVTSAKLVAVWPRGMRLSRPHPDPAAVHATMLEALAERALQFDVVHCHVDWLHLPLLRRLEVPFLTTLHGRLDLPYLASTFRRFPGSPFVSISDNQRAQLLGVEWLGTVHHGLPPNMLQPCFQPGSYLAFLGRITPEKGPDVAIRIAKAVGLPLRIAAKVPRAENRYFTEQIKPLIDGGDVEFIGEVDDAGKEKLLGNAMALLFPIDWPEPFGLVLIEAMACGTPVIAWRCGSVAEIVEDGKTGFIVDDVECAAAVVPLALRLDRATVRRRFEQRFTAERMAMDYLSIYRGLPGVRRDAARLRRAGGDGPALQAVA